MIPKDKKPLPRRRINYNRTTAKIWSVLGESMHFSDILPFPPLDGNIN